jgi:hypothetical protein
MKHHLLICILSIFFTEKLYTQNIKYELSNEVLMSGNFDFIRKDSNSFFAVSSGENSNWQIVNLSSGKMNINSNAEISTLRINGAKADDEKWFYVKDKLCMFSSVTRSKHSSFYMNYLNADGTLNKESKLIGEADKMDDWGFNVKQSSDGSKILSYSLHDYWSTKKPCKVSCKMMDINLNVIWEKTLEAPSGSRLGELFIDNNGNLYSFAYINNKNKKDFSSAQIKLVFYDYKKDSSMMLDIGYDDNYHFGEKLHAFDKDNNLIYAGFYSQSEKNAKVKRPDGLYVFKIDMNKFNIAKKSISKLNENPADESFGKDYHLDHLIIRENGSVIISGESRDVFSNVTHDIKSQTSSGSVYYNFGHIIVASFDQEMKPAWIHEISKCQSSSKGVSVFSSYSLLVNSKDVMITYNDNAKNVDEKQESKESICLDEEPTIFEKNAFRNMVFSVTTIDEQGKAKIVRKDFADMVQEFTSGKDELRELGRKNVYKNYVQINSKQFIIYNCGLRKFIKFTYE